VDIRKVKKLIEMLEASDLEELEITEGEESVKLVKKSSRSEVLIQNQSEPVSATESEVVEEKKVSESAGEKITSPMVGTFYSSSSPGSEPFIKIGDEVKEGDVVCIVEAMKMMNEIKSDFSGKVSEILVNNSDPVEFGQALFIIS